MCVCFCIYTNVITLFQNLLVLVKMMMVLMATVLKMMTMTMTGMRMMVNKPVVEVSPLGSVDIQSLN